MAIATKVLKLRPETFERFKEYRGYGETSDRALSNMLNIIDELRVDMGMH